MALSLKFLFPHVHCECTEMQFIYACWSFYPVTILKSFISSRSSAHPPPLVDSLKFPRQIIMSFANRHSFKTIFFLFNTYAFKVSFSFLISVAGTSNTMVKKSGGKHPFLGPHLRGRAFSVSLLHKILAVVLLYLYQLE